MSRAGEDAAAWRATGPAIAGRVGRPVPRAIVLRRTALKLLLAAMMLAGLAVTAGPYLFAVLWSLLPLKEVAYGNYVTTNLILDNYITAWTQGLMGKYMLTTVIFAVWSVLAAIILGGMAAYSFGRLRYPGREVLFSIFIASMMIPGSVTLIPTVLVVVHFPLAGGNDLLGRGGIGLYNSMPGLLLPHMLSIGTIFLLRQFFRTLPRDLEDAARIDGAGEFRIMFQVIMPLAGPGLATMAVLNFTGSWNAYLWPLVISANDTLYTVAVGLQQLRALEMLMGFTAPSAIAGAVMVVIPIVVVFIFGQRYFKRGIAISGLK